MSQTAPIPRWLTILLGMFIAIGPAATDMYLPAFPAVEASYGTAPGTAQLTLAAWFAGLAIGQMTQGTLSDRFGRRAPLIGGLILFTISSIGCALAPTIGWLAAFRALAAVGSSAGMVIGRAVVRDLADGPVAGVMMSRLVLVMGLAPILAPSIGGLILIWADWRVIFWVLAGYGAISGLIGWRFLPETLPPNRRSKLGLAAQIARYGIILRERTFITHAAMGAAGGFCMFAYLNGWLLPKLGLSVMLTAISRLSLFATGTLTILAFSGVTSMPLIVAPMVLALTCQGFSNANCSVGALSKHAAYAGSASALMGLGQFSLGATSGLLVGLLTDGTPRGMAALMLCGSIGAVLANHYRPRSS